MIHDPVDLREIKRLVMQVKLLSTMNCKLERQNKFR